VLAHSITLYALREARSQVQVETRLKVDETLPVVDLRGRPAVLRNSQETRLNAWLDKFCCINARGNTRLLCFRPQIFWVYRTLVAEGMEGSYILFLGVWHDCIKGVSIPRRGDDLKHCATCMEIAYLRLQAVRSSQPQEVMQLDEKLRRHISLNYEERAVLYRLSQDPDWYVLSGDGTNPIFLPTAILDSDFKRKLPKELISFFAVIHRSRRHGLPESVFHLGIGGSGKPSACNDVSSIAREVERVIALPDRPPNLLIQSDGGPSIWNSVFVAYCAHLMALAFFKRVRAMRLLVGHGGERQDGSTSPLRDGVRGQAFIGGPNALDSVVKDAYKEQPEVHLFSDIALNGKVDLVDGPLTRDFSLLYQRMAKVSGIKQSNLEQGSDAGIHVWEFENHDGWVNMRVKRLSSEDDRYWSPWYPVLEIASVSHDILSGLPFLGYGYDKNGLCSGGKRKFGTPHDVAVEISGDARLMRMMDNDDQDWWHSLAEATKDIEFPNNFQRAAKVSSKPKKSVDLSQPPSLKVIKQKAPSVSVSDSNTGVEPPQVVKGVGSLLNRRVVDGHLEYLVSWKPSGVSGNTWENLQGLIDLGAVDLVSDFDALAEERTTPVGIAAEAGFKYRGQDATFTGLDEAERKGATYLKCSECGKESRGTRGLAQHKKKSHPEKK